MDAKSRERLKKIVAKPVKELLDYEIDFLRARSSYLTAEEIIKYKKCLQVESSSSYVDKPKEAAESYNELQKMAKKLGMDKVVGKTRKELETFIDAN